MTTAKYRVLLVDDDAILRSATARLLSLFFDVATAGCLEEARCALAESTLPDAIVTDLDLGTERGETLLGEVRAQHPEIARIVLSGSIEVFPRVAPLVSAVLAKGQATPNDIVNAIRTHACSFQPMRRAG